MTPLVSHPTADGDTDPVIRSHLTCGKHSNHRLRIYTRTIVMWAYNLDIDIAALWENVKVEEDADSLHVPRVRMISNAEGHRGTLKKRQECAPFRSVVSLDVQLGKCMPNLKISRRNTVQATGCQDMESFGRILHYLSVTYMGSGFSSPNPHLPAGYVGDIVLANVHFHIGWPVNRELLRDSINMKQGKGIGVATYEPMLRDVSVTVKYMDNVTPNQGHVYPSWSLTTAKWTLVPSGEVNRMAPQAGLREAARCQTFRIFATGSVVHVGRWPCAMQDLHDRFCQYMQNIKQRVTGQPTSLMRQITLDIVWCPIGCPINGNPKCQRCSSSWYSVVAHKQRPQKRRRLG